MRKEEDAVCSFDEIVKVTELAILYDFGGEQIWIPKSQIIDSEEVLNRFGVVSGKITIPFWLALDKGLI